MKKVTLSIFASSVLFLVGCEGEAPPKVEDNGGKDVPKPETRLLTDAERAEIMSTLSGTWYTACEEFEGEYRSESFTFDAAGEFNNSTDYFEDSNCIISSTTESIGFGGDYQIADQKLLESGIYGTEVDFYLDQLSEWRYGSFVTANGQLYLSDFNSVAANRDYNVDFDNPHVKR
ncbi:hypothetical protein [Reinekea sp. G2M2-21]|uniref:hypothetical protein n=1 Tax=Reinekea sp. G2M2-21 TaxID=2788942 RepID=UPI0018A9C894|nr:hypothetical protein [Reinekea sp. G2M2-21]